MQLRDYQEAAVDKVERFVADGSRGQTLVVVGPTGCGKGVVEAELLKRLGDDAWLVTPRVEIARGILEKKGAIPKDASEREVVDAGWEHRCMTPVRFRNALRAGRVPRVSCLLLDEGHHVTASTWDEVVLLTGMPPTALFTATYYRGTARSTELLRKRFGEPWTMVSLREAARRGDVSIPTWTVWPLVDDDEVTLDSSGEFDVRQVASAYADKVEDLAARSVSAFYANESWGRPTVFALPSTAVAHALQAALARHGAPSTVVHAGTRPNDRQHYFDLLRSSSAALLQIAVLGEGVDLPVRRLIDARPCMSPTAWMQLVGRETRPVSPGESAPEYVCTNRNLARHAYLFEGLLPPRAVVDCQQAFGGPGQRGAHRALGLESVGRFRGSEVKAADGCVCLFYALSDVSNGRMREFGCLVHPATPEPIWGQRVHTPKPDGTKGYGKWVRAEAPSDLRGFGSVSSGEPTPKMKAWWDRTAATRGLDVEQKVTRKTFQVLPFMLDLGMRFKGGA